MHNLLLSADLVIRTPTTNLRDFHVHHLVSSLLVFPIHGTSQSSEEKWAPMYTVEIAVESRIKCRLHNAGVKGNRLG